MVFRQTVGDGSEQEAGVGGEPGLEVVGMAEEAVVDVFGVEERDLDAGVGEELGELEHARHVSLRWEGKYENYENSRRRRRWRRRRRRKEEWLCCILLLVLIHYFHRFMKWNVTMWSYNSSYI